MTPTQAHFQRRQYIGRKCLPYNNRDYEGLSTQVVTMTNTIINERIIATMSLFADMATMSQYLNMCNKFVKLAILWNVFFTGLNLQHWCSYVAYL